jgi:spermidine/putrescine transport system permease protein
LAALGRQLAQRVTLVSPMTALLVAFVAVPLGIFVAYSFWRVDAFQIVHEWNTSNYTEVFTDPLYRKSLWNALLIGTVTAVICCTLAFGLAWAVRFHLSRWRDTIVLVIVISSISSYLARLYAWRSILGSKGVVNYSLDKAGLIDEPLEFLIFSRFAMIVALVHIFLPFAFLPIYANLLETRPEVLQAGRVLGAGPLQNFRRVAFPLASTGIAVSFAYVLIFATGDYAVPAFLGGPQGVVAANVIAEQFGTVFNWPLGAALSFVYMLFLGVVLGAVTLLVTRRARRLRR